MVLVHRQYSSLLERTDGKPPLPSFQTEMSIPYALTPDATDVILDPIPNDPNFMRDISKWDDGTDASAFVTVYANNILNNGTHGLELVTEEGLVKLAKRLAAQLSGTGRKLFVRWCPEMNGSWFYYGPTHATPEEYIATWKQMYKIIKQYNPNVVFVWSPNFDLMPGDKSYWPGPDYVDWIGTSVYYKGFGSNGAMPTSYINESIYTIYNEYAVTFNKPFVISEASGAWESGSGTLPGTGQFIPNVVNYVDQATFQKAFWSPILSSDFLDQFPLLQAVYIFDIAKKEEFWTDFKVSNDTATRNAFLGLVDALDAKGRMTWASPTKPVVASATQTVAASAATGAATTTANAKSSANKHCAGFLVAAAFIMSLVAFV
ncbi:glycoside hydrolase [Rhizoclosmatium globosum]|uniref:Glycoside hydrolase n=1 Tax=Rhizoclosmatium globosum TaxID=329046 RepID=A0A1Y2CV18_9FUNG|nr:glycoside hydrolase [Rhizoclosmatium globosum]|eukprot:ORY50891.1 glycoside hydrolase [Rhizoclosmatium globosum]